MKDRIVRCRKCGNEVPAIPAPPSKCRECGYDEKLAAFDAACDALQSKLSTGSFSGLDLIKKWHEEGSERHVSLVYFH